MAGLQNSVDYLNSKLAVSFGTEEWRGNLIGFEKHKPSQQMHVLIRQNVKNKIKAYIP